jgi:hypothetical protein
MTRSLSESIKKTIKYGKRYGVKYSTEDLFFRLISNKCYGKDKIPKIINPTPARYYEEKLEKTTNLALKLAKKFEFIEMVGITGSVAAGYPKKGDDIDLMIITKEDSLWITRLGVRMWIWINKIPHRKYYQKQNRDEFCFNLWLQEKSLRLPKNKQNLRNAMDLILMKPVVNKNKIYERFILENGWAKKYVANGYNRINKMTNDQFLISNEEQKTKRLWKIINLMVFWLQYFYMRRRFAGEKVDLQRAFFHPEK